MSHTPYYSSLVDAHQGLLRKGYDKNYNVISPASMKDDTGRNYSPYQLSIDEFYRFEGESDPADNSIIYAVSANDGSKGTLVDTYGAEGSQNLAQFVLQVEQKMQNNLLKKYNFVKSNLTSVVKKEEKLLIGLAAGAVVGAVIGILLAPKKNKLSATLASTLSDLADEAQERGLSAKSLLSKLSV